VDCRRSDSELDASVMRALILLMYGAALRTSEALSLTVSDVDLSGAVLTIRHSKFFKNRLVPLGPNTVRVLAEYASRQYSRSRKPDDRFFVGRNSKQIPIHMFERAFKQIRRHAGLHREGFYSVALGRKSAGIYWQRSDMSSYGPIRSWPDRCGTL
jgi:integrase/recombinase XerD